MERFDICPASKEFRMKKLYRWIALAVIVTMAIAHSSVQAASGVAAFPGAEGFGAGAVGGRGGKVYEVTNTNDSGAGSLRNCVQASGPRVCVFRTGGLIVLKTALSVRNPYITIAGQTAPGGGITLRTASGGDVFSTRTSQVVMRYLSVRPGPGGSNHGDQIASNGGTLSNIVLDHMTYSWGVDSDVETWYRVSNLSLQWSIISEALDCSTHPKGCHSKGVMIGGYAGSESNNSRGSENISLLHNLMAHDGERTPLMQLCGSAQVINNITYNPYWTFAHQQDDCAVSSVNRINWIGNYHKKGPDTTSSTDLKVIPADSGSYSGGAQVYVLDNIGPSRTSNSQPDSDWVDSGSRKFIVSTPATAPAVTTTDAQTAYTEVLNDAGNSRGLDCEGNWYSRRDAIDTRVVNDVRNGTGHIIDNPSQVGGWITPASGTPCADSDHDGMPDVYETKNGLNPNNAADGPVDADGNGYTNLEEYLNGGDTVAPPADQTATLVSSGAQDGMVLESSETSNAGNWANAGGTVFMLGDSATNQQYRTILSFNTSGLPDHGAIVSVVLKIKQAGTAGANPFGALGSIAVDVRAGAFGGNPTLQVSDFQAAASKAGAFSMPNAPSSGWYTGTLSASSFGYINLTGITQFRLRFAKDDNNNLAADDLKFYSGNYAANPAYRPRLVIKYTAP